ncbi:MAG: heme ABC exporter ATP-binding protein CcmA [Pseudomonadota bacterium]
MELVVQDLQCRRGGRLVLDGTGFTVPGGRAAVVRGPNGAGKSTLLRALAGILPISDGSVRLGDITLTGDRSGYQEQVAYAGHLDAVKPALTVGQNLGIWAGIHGAKSGRVAEALGHFGIEHISDRPAAQCSAGQKRRLGLARLMVLDRPLWLLDEPTVSLDTASSELVSDLVRRHCAGGGIALVATHIDLGLSDAEVIEVTPVQPRRIESSDDADFLAGDWT